MARGFHLGGAGDSTVRYKDVDLTTIPTTRWDLKEGTIKTFTTPPFYLQANDSNAISVETQQTFKIANYSNLKIEGYAYSTASADRFQVQFVNVDSGSVDLEYQDSLYSGGAGKAISTLISVSNLNPLVDYKIRVHKNGHSASDYIRFDTFKLNAPIPNKQVPAKNPLYLVRNGKIVGSGLLVGSILNLTETSDTDGDCVLVNTISSGTNGSARFSQVIDGHIYSNLHITFKTRNSRSDLNRIGITYDSTATQAMNVIPQNASSTKVTRVLELYESTDNYLAAHVYRQDTTATINIYEAYAD